MEVTRLKQVRRLYSNPMAPLEYNRAYQRKWVRAVRMLGDKWHLAKQQPRLDAERGVQ